MIEGQNKVSFPDSLGGKDVILEINWSPFSDGLVRITIGDKKAVIKREDLFGLMFVIATNEQQDNLTPVRNTKITKYFKQHRVKVKKNLGKGDELVVNCEISVPTIVEEGLKGTFLKKTITGSKILVPR